MSWVCSRVWWDDWLHPVVKPALTPISCLVPLECMGKARLGSPRGGGLGGGDRWEDLYLTAVQPLGPVGGSCAVLLCMENSWELRT